MRRTSLLLVLLASPAFAQRQAGSVLGRVTEFPSNPGQAGGAGLRGVSVTLQGGAGRLTTTTDEKGSDRFPAVSPATYEIRAELAGFEGQSRHGVVVPIAKTITVDLVLRIPGEAETVASSLDLPLGAPLAVLAPRQVTLGARWSF